MRLKIKVIMFIKIDLIFKEENQMKKIYNKLIKSNFNKKKYLIMNFINIKIIQLKMYCI